MRIIAGTHRGRTLQTPDHDAVRPTADRVRGAIFNILVHAPWAGDVFSPTTRVADIFCGTGALGLEALSRGAGLCCFVDKNRAVLDLARANARLLKEESRAEFIKADAAQLPVGVASYHLLFLDPPYGKNLLPATLCELARKKWLAPAAILVIETAKKEPVTFPDFCPIFEQRHYGGTTITFLKNIHESS